MAAGRARRLRPGGLGTSEASRCSAAFGEQLFEVQDRRFDQVGVEFGTSTFAEARFHAVSTRLLQLGVPADLVRAVDLDADADDLAWTTALATAIAGACGAIPAGPSLMVGPLADRLAGLVDGPTARSQVWFDALRDGRWLHLVVGGEGWRDHLPSGPCVLSWTRQQDLPDALRCALELGLTLGYGPVGGVTRRARPLDIALAIRELVDAS